MTTTTFRSMTFRTGLIFAGLLVTCLPTRAIDPEPDYHTLIMPTLVPKAGHNGLVPSGYQSGLIRNAYETTFEQYWRETSYHRFDANTGLKERGFYTDTKTYGYVYMPWPINTRTNIPAAFAGASLADMFVISDLNDEVSDLASGEPFNEFPEGAPPRGGQPELIDGVWTPGEAFRDENGNGSWDDAIPDEDFWNADNTVPRVDCLGRLLPDLRSILPDPDEWDGERGEFFADYNGNSDLANRVVGYDSSVTIVVADIVNRTNRTFEINELDIIPDDGCSTLYGDFTHTYVDSGNPGGGVDVAPNGEFDYTVGVPPLYVPQVVPATVVGTSNAVFVTYQRFENTSDGSIYTGAAPVPPDSSSIVLREISVPVYQAGELYRSRNFDFPNFNWYGDPNLVGDGTWTPGAEAEEFEDWLSWWDPTGGEEGSGAYTVLNALSGHPLRSVFEEVTFLNQAEYEAYIRWNYPGDAAGLIGNANNGLYDGPGEYDNSGDSKHRQSGFVEDISSAVGAWDTRTFASWQDWWLAAFGGEPEGFASAIPSVSPYVAVEEIEEEENVGWIPSSGSWGYDAPREFCDMPSSIYHLGGDPGAATNVASLGIFRVDPLTLEPVFLGDQGLGESTSPWEDSIYGVDYGAHPVFPSPANLPDTVDDVINAAGPFCVFVHGISGWDAGNLLSFEWMSRRFMPPTNATFNLADTNDLETFHTRQFRDVNLDGMIDSGATLELEANYLGGLEGGNVEGTGLYPYSRERYMEDAIEAWDVAEDFDLSFRGPATGTNVPLYGFPVYPPPDDGEDSSGYGLLGGPAGANIDILTLDREPFNIVFQARPLLGATIGGSGENSDGFEVEGAVYQMGLLAHEQGHDILGWPDLYDYDTFSPNQVQFNQPIAGYDLQAGGFVHGIPDMKSTAAVAGGTADGWIDIQELDSLLPLDGGPVILEFPPIENNVDGYFIFRNENIPGEAEHFFFWYASGNTDFPVPGGAGVYVSHTDLSSFTTLDGNLFAVPLQQRQNNHFTWEMVQADGLNELQDGVNSGDEGDPFPGSTEQYVFSADTMPPARWWDQTDSGIRILDVQLPANPGDPALVTMERYTVSNAWPWTSDGIDNDGDGIVDAWEYHYFGDLTTADDTSDADFDGLIDLHEYILRTDPNDPAENAQLRDVDGDGLGDVSEIVTHGTDPWNPDTDDDGYEDGAELDVLAPNPLDDRGIGAVTTSPLHGRSPAIHRSLVLGAAGSIGPMGLRAPIDLQLVGDQDRFRFTLVEASSTNATNNVSNTATITVNSTTDGASIDQRFLDLQGVIDAPAGVQSVQLFNNDQLIGDVPLDTNGNFDERVIIFQGNNNFRFVVVDNDGLVSTQEINVTGNFSAAGLRVTQTWTPNGDLDTWLVDPNGRNMGFTASNPRGQAAGTGVASSGPSFPPNATVAEAIPGSTLDVDDIPGTGPENITLESGSVSNGTYEVWVNNFSNGPGAASTVRVLVDEGGPNEQFLEWGPQILAASDGNGTDPAAWWLVTTVTFDGSSPIQFSVPGTPVPGSRVVTTTGGSTTVTTAPGGGSESDILTILRDPTTGIASVEGFTLEAWVKPGDTNQTGSLIEYTVTQPNNVIAYGAALEANVPVFHLGTEAGGVQELRAGPLAGDVWHHLAFVYDEAANTMRIHVNGEVAVAKQILTPRLKLDGFLAIGQTWVNRLTTDSGSFTDLLLDEVRIWNRARPGGLIAAAMQSPVNPDASSLVALYTFDDGGTGIEDATRRLDRNYDLVTVPLDDQTEQVGADGTFQTADDLTVIGSDAQNDYVTALDAAPVYGFVDRDGDLIADWWEELFYGAAGVDPGVDSEADNLTALIEFLAGTNPFSGDTDGDGILDQVEDMDLDGLLNLQEQNFGSHPRLADTDDDNIFDFDEALAGTQLNDSLSPFVNRAILLDGSTNAYVEAPRSPRFFLGRFTLEAVVKPESFGSDMEIVSREVEDGVYNYRLYLDSLGRPVVSFTNGDLLSQVGLASPTPLALGDWQHVLASFDSDLRRLWLEVDGVQVASLTTVGIPAGNGRGNEQTRVGVGFVGCLDEVRIWDRYPGTRTEALREEPISGLENGLIAYLRFDDWTHFAGTSARLNWKHGQVQDFTADRADYQTGWIHAWTLGPGTAFASGISYVGGQGNPGGGVVTILPEDCALDAALDPMNAAWTTGAISSDSSDSNKWWRCVTDEANSGAFSVRAGGLDNASDEFGRNLQNNETAWLETQVVGPGEVCFSLKYGIEPHVDFPNDPADYTYFKINGSTQYGLTGEADWTNLCFEVPAGVSTLRWEYKKDDFLAVAPDAVWIDDVQFTHSGPDGDLDGLSDAYETSVFGTDPSNPDSDGDGTSDGNEVALGLDPNVVEVPEVSITAPPCVSWTASAGLKYVVLRSTTLIDPVWEPAPNGVAPNERNMQVAFLDGPLEYCDPEAPGIALYRVIRVP